MRVSDYTYDLPDDLIAKFPPKVRGTSRLLVLDRDSGYVEHRRYKDLLLEPGDLLVLNDTRVIKARLEAVNQKGAPRELLLLEDHDDADAYSRKVMHRGKLQPGELLTIGGHQVKIEEVLGGGIAAIRSSSPVLELAEASGKVPLPPYMNREATSADTERYQTVFAKREGSVAAPTASLNFTADIEAGLRQKGIQTAYLTLHVGLGTFLPIRTDEVEGHKMHSEHFEIPEATVRAVQSTKKSGGRVIALGTTVARTLEYAADGMEADSGLLSGEADIFIYPGYEFRIVDGLLTNFHAPRSTVLMLAAAFAGWNNLKEAYDEAIKQEYAFLSYGDSMLII
jgi:S-adenosylmethionine:tRNA ribosyltransferase-isomerase